MRKIFTEILIMVILGIAVYFLATNAITGYLLVQADKAKHNSTFGSIRVIDVFEDFNAFDIDIDNPIFQKVGDHFEIDLEYPKVWKFDGDANKYNLLFNDQPADVTTSFGLRLDSSYKLAFWDLEGNHAMDITIDIRFIFSVTRVYLTLSTQIDESHLGFLNQYLKVTGLNLRIIEEQYNSSPIETSSSVFAFFVNNGETIKVVGVPLNATIQNFSIATPEGHSAIFSVAGQPIDINTFVFTQNTTVQVKFEPIKFLITFTNGIWTETQQVIFGATPTVTAPTIQGFDFIGWDRPFPIISSGTYTAIYKPAAGYVGMFYKYENGTTNNVFAALGEGDWSFNGKVYGKINFSGSYSGTSLLDYVQIPYYPEYGVLTIAGKPEGSLVYYPYDLLLFMASPPSVIITDLVFYYSEYIG